MAANLKLNGKLVQGAEAALHAGAGRLLGYMICHDQAATQTVTFSDAAEPGQGAALHVVRVAAAQSPFLAMFAREDAVPFAAGLCVEPGACAVMVWSIGYRG